MPRPTRFNKDAKGTTRLPKGTPYSAQELEEFMDEWIPPGPPRVTVFTVYEMPRHAMDYLRRRERAWFKSLRARKG